ncbi:MAG: hypothetical protein EXR68_01075 [Dehalococcoidia bacterium]|nr:hypothetical protein [Dehalococcoidia bacterium]
MSPVDYPLRAVLRPGSIAVVGASPRSPRPGIGPYNRMLKYHKGGKIDRIENALRLPTRWG